MIQGFCTQHKEVSLMKSVFSSAFRECIGENALFTTRNVHSAPCAAIFAGYSKGEHAMYTRAHVCSVTRLAAQKKHSVKSMLHLHWTLRLTKPRWKRPIKNILQTVQGWPRMCNRELQLDRTANILLLPEWASISRRGWQICSHLRGSCLSCHEAAAGEPVSWTQIRFSANTSPDACDLWPGVPIVPAFSKKQFSQH